MTGKKPKVSIIGCGNVGMRYAYALAIKRVVRQIVIVDVDRERLEGEVMDLSHGAPYISPVEIHAGDYPDINGSDIVVVTAGHKQKPNQSRLDLAKRNVDLFKRIIPTIVQHAPSAILLVATNPVDLLSYAAFKISSKPPHEVIGSGTVLDSARFRFLLGRHCRVDPRNVHAYILGEHGDSEFAVWSRVMIGGMLFKDYCCFCNERGRCKHDGVLDKILNEVKESAYKIIKLKGETSYGIGLALVRITQAIIYDENAILLVSVLMRDYLGIDDVYLSLPAVIDRKGVRQILQLEYDSREMKQLDDSAHTLKRVIQKCGL
jgi:L-lactate dehydrogenase